MNKTKKFFLAFLIAIGALFLFTCFAIIRIFVFSFDGTTENVIGAVYLFLLLLAESYIFYQAFRAYIIKPSVMNIVMIDEHGIVIQKSVRVSLVLTIISSVFFAFTLALELGLNKVITIFSTGVTYAVMNTALVVGILALFFHLYPHFHTPIEKKNAEEN